MTVQRDRDMEFEVALRVAKRKDLGINKDDSEMLIGVGISKDQLQEWMENFTESWSTNIGEEKPFFVQQFCRWVSECCREYGISVPYGLVNTRAVGKMLNANPEDYDVKIAGRYGNKTQYMILPL